MFLCKYKLYFVELAPYMSYYYRERTDFKWKIYMIAALPNRNGRELQTVYIRARSGTDSAQWDWGIMGYLF